MNQFTQTLKIGSCLTAGHNLLLFCPFQPILIDARGHLLGRLAAVVAKTILQGIYFLYLFPFKMGVNAPDKKLLHCCFTSTVNI